MLLSLPKTLKLEGQEFIYNQESKTIVLEITQPFINAAASVGWDKNEFGSPGFGINKSITNFVEHSKFKLLIHNLENSQNYWTSYDKLKNFRKHNPCTYTVSGKEIFVFPWKIFVPKVSMLEEYQ